MIWIETKPGLWRDVAGAYVIARFTLPDDRPDPSDIYIVNRFDPAMVAAYPGNLGYFRSQELTLDAAMAFAERDAYGWTHNAERSIPEDFPALALARFFWPISEGTSMGALAVIRDGDRIVARVVGMARGEDAFEPGTYAEIDLTDLMEQAT
jgi:hypothetical protein